MAFFPFFTQPFSNISGLRHVRIGQKCEEFLSASTVNQIGCARALFYVFCQQSDDVIADIVSVDIVHAFEIVDISQISRNGNIRLAD